MIVVLAPDAVTAVAVHSCGVALAVQFNALRLLTITFLHCSSELSVRIRVVCIGGGGGSSSSCSSGGAFRVLMRMMAVVVMMMMVEEIVFWLLFRRMIFIVIILEIIEHEHLELMTIDFIVHAIVLKDAFIKRVTLRHRSGYTQLRTTKTGSINISYKLIRERTVRVQLGLMDWIQTINARQPYMYY